LAGLLFISGVLLLYTAVIAPVQIFLWEFNEEECNKFPTLFFDVFVDFFFIVRIVFHKLNSRYILLQSMDCFDTWQVQVEVVLNFLTGALDMSDTYCDDFQIIAARYMAAPNGFWFDFATSLPWSLNDLLAYQVT
jgi:hypothetical protein